MPPMFTPGSSAGGWRPCRLLGDEPECQPKFRVSSLEQRDGRFGEQRGVPAAPLGGQRRGVLR